MAAPRFPNDDEAAQYYLSTLRDGSRAEKIVARDGLAEIFARRGLVEEAAELYELNIRAGVRAPELFERLSDVYRQLGEHESAEAALAEGRRLRSTASVLAAPSPSAETQVLPVPAASPNGAVAPSDASPATGPAVTARLPTQQDGVETVPLPLESTPVPVQQSGRSIPGPILAVGTVVFLIIIPVILLALLVVNPIALYLEGRAAGPTVDAQSSEPPHLKVAAGLASTWYVQTGRSVSGLWASPGLELALGQDVGADGRTFGVTGPRPQSWGETITIVERRGQGRANQQTIVPATFEAPTPLPPTGTTLEGRIVGQVLAPRLSESSQFNTAAENVDLPVRLVVVSTPELWLDRFVNAFWMFFDEDRWLLVSIGALLGWCILAGGAAILSRAGHS